LRKVPAIFTRVKNSRPAFIINRKQRTQIQKAGRKFSCLRLDNPRKEAKMIHYVLTNIYFILVGGVTLAALTIKYCG
jgi:hypothetical protein